jgi:hypothetical protein
MSESKSTTTIHKHILKVFLFVHDVNNYAHPFWTYMNICVGKNLPNELEKAAEDFL